MTIEELREKLGALVDGNRDMEENHVCADDLLLQFINDEQVREIYDSIEKWYS